MLLESNPGELTPQPNALSNGLHGKSEEMEKKSTFFLLALNPLQTVTAGKGTSQIWVGTVSKETNMGLWFHFLTTL